MGSAADIHHKESLRAWLEGRPQAQCVWIAYRAAMRVAPIVWADPFTDKRKGDLTTLPVLRCTLISGVANVGHTKRLRVAAANAAIAGRNSVINVIDRTAPLDAVLNAIDAASVLSNSDDVAARVVCYTAATAALWRDIASDCLIIEDSKEADGIPRRMALWSGENPLERLWTQARDQWSSQGEGWQFWIDWYEDALAGREPDWALLTKVALIGNEVWEAGAEAVNARIGELLREAADDGRDPARRVTSEMARIDPPETGRVKAVQRAMVQNRRELPPTFDAVLGFIALEVERLQNRNYRDAEDAKESQRQIRTLAFLSAAVERLKSLVPTTVQMPQADAIEAEKLSRLFIGKFADWPRSNADDLVDSTCRAALIGVTTVMLPMIGVTAPYALAAGIVLFGGKKVAEAAKAAKDLIKPGS